MRTHPSVLPDSGNIFGGTLTAAIIDPALGTGDGNIKWTYTLSNAVAQQAAAHTYQESFTILIDDGHGGITSQIITVGVHGRNDAPIAIDENEIAVEEGVVLSSNVLSNDIDVDLGAVLQVNQIYTGNIEGAGTLGSLGTALVGLYGSLTLNSDGTYSYVLNHANPLVNSLAVGETLTESFNYRVTDGLRSDRAVLNITIEGSNDAPTVVAALATTVAENDSASTLALLSGASDVDHGETATLSIINMTYSVDGVATGLPAGVSLSGYDLTIDPAHLAFDHLAIGEQTVIQVGYDIQDVHGAIVHQTASITVTGTNDAPTVSAVDVNGVVIEDFAVSAGNLNDFGLITFDDVDLSDNHGVSISADSGNSLGGVLTATVTDSATGLGNGSIQWNYSVDNSLTQALGIDDVVYETFTVTVSDQHGGTVDQVITVAIIGNNDAPTITSGSIVSIDEGVGSAGAVVYTTVASDIDVNDTITSYSLSGVDAAAFSIDVNGVVTLNAAADYETKSNYSFDITVTDNNGASTTQTVTLNVNDIDGTAIVGTINPDDYTLNLDTAVPGEELPYKVDLKESLDHLNVNTSASQIRITLTSDEVGNSSALDSNTTAPQDGGLAVRIQAEDGSDNLVGQASRSDDEGTVITASVGTTFDVRDLVTGTQYGNQFTAVVLGSSTTDNLDFSSSGGQLYINAGEGNDSITGGLGADTLLGGLGDDTYTIDGSDTLIELVNGGIDTVQINNSYTLGDNLENLTLTGTANVDGTGNSLNNTILGNSGNNVLNGGAGTDTLIGGLGDDTYIIDDIGDIAIESSNAGTDRVFSNISYTLGADFENLILYGTSNINGTGNGLANLIVGNTGNNILDGAAGADSLIGGLGDDTYIIDNAGDVVTELLSEGTDLVQSSLTYTLGANVENLTLTGSSDINGTGNTLSNTITGNIGNNILDGGVGADTLIGGSGNDTYFVDNIGDVVTEALNEGTDRVFTSISYSLAANVENLILSGSSSINGTGNTLANTIVGNAGNNILDGGAGDDTLDGGVGADTLIGGSGNDIYLVDNTGDVITELAGGGTDRVLSSVTYTLSANVDNLTLTGSADLNGTGNASANTIIGNTGNNLLDGGAGADTLIGGAGNDTYLVDNIADVVTETANAGTDRVFASISYSLAANVENLILSGSASINGTGNGLANTIVGNAGSNILDGGAGDDTLDGSVGADTLIGGLGNDTYLVDNIGDMITELTGEGTDRVLSSVSYTLSANVESLTLTGSSDINGTGNASANTITGNSGNNIIDGGSGADTLIGGTGNDTYIIDNIGDIITEQLNAGTDSAVSSINYTLHANVENLILSGTANINGTGNALANTILGNAANNLLDGGVGADNLIGGAGNDTYFVDNIGDVVTEALSEGTDRVFSSISYSLAANIETLILSGTANSSGTGNDLSNTIIGNAGNNTLIGGLGDDTLDGGVGIDTLVGGSGDDTYLVDNTNDVVTELVSEGTDRVLSSASYTLSNNIEILVLNGTSNINGTGNDLSNTIVGNTGNNILDGKAGHDIYTGGTGADTLIFGLLTANSATGGNDSDAWLDFEVGLNADKIDISDLLVGFNGSQDLTTVDQYISVFDTGSDVIVLLDRDGAVGNYSDTLLLTLKNVDVSLQTLLDNQQLVLV